jgi:hypothetical protein
LHHGSLSEVEAFMAAQLLALHIDLLGPGPFQVPLLVQLGASLETIEDKHQVVAQFLSDDGKRIFTTISFRAVEQFLDLHESARLTRAGLGEPQPIDLSQPAFAYELPNFASFDGYFQRGPGHRTLILSTEHTQKVLFPLDSSTYCKLAGHLTFAIYFYRAGRRRQ